MKSLFAAAVAVSLAGMAEAATVTVTTTLTADQFAAATNDVLAPTAETGAVVKNATGSISTRRSPYDTVDGLAATGKYHSVQAQSTATYTFGSLQDSFTLLWGSPDTYNSLAFFSGVDQIALGVFGLSLTGDEIAALGSISPLGRNFGLVTVTDILFDRVVLSSGSNAFEYGLVSTTPAPVPLPAAAWMLIAGLGALAAAARKRA